MDGTHDKYVVGILGDVSVQYILRLGPHPRTGIIACRWKFAVCYRGRADGGQRPGLDVPDFVASTSRKGALPDALGMAATDPISGSYRDDGSPSFQADDLLTSIWHLELLEGTLC